MAKSRPVGFSAIVLVTACASLAGAANISTKKLFIKDHLTKPEKRQVQVQSTDAGVLFSAAGDPGANGASLHLYSATDDFCVILPPGPDWKNKHNKWKYKSKVTKNSAQIKNAKLLVTIMSGVTYTLSDNGTQGAVNAQVQFGTGTRFCMRCTGNKKNQATKFLGKDCAAAPCDAEPSSCGSVSTTTVPGTTTTSTTCPAPTGVILKGALPPTPGRFNYNMQVGLPAANSACNTNFTGTHACTYQELQAAAAACDLPGLKDTASNPVAGFWAIDSAQPPLSQCNDDGVGGSNLNWEYQTAHTASRGQKVSLDNAHGTLGSLQSGLQCNFSGASSVGCCQ